MNNQNGMLTAILSLATTGVVILGIVRGIRSKSFQPFLQTIMGSSPALQIPQAAQGMMNGQAAQNMTQPLQGMMNNQGSQQQSATLKNPTT